MFGGNPLQQKSDAKLIISVGYQPLRLHEFLDAARFQISNIKLLLPFPSIPPGFISNWTFILQIRRELPELGQEAIVRVHTHTLPLVFDQIVALTENGRSPIVVLAPFGPKSVSLAMCLYGASRRSNSLSVEIGYTQPRVYGDQYSVGVAKQDGVPLVHTYCLKLSGRNIYQIP